MSTTTTTLPHILLVALGDGQSKVCQETNRIFKFLKCQYHGIPVNQSQSPLEHLVPNHIENRLILSHLLHDLLFKFWAKLLRFLKHREFELTVKKRVTFSRDLRQLMTLLRSSKQSSSLTPIHRRQSHENQHENNNEEDENEDENENEENDDENNNNNHGGDDNLSIIGDDLRFLEEDDDDDEEEDEEEMDEKNLNEKNSKKNKRFHFNPKTAFSTTRSTHYLSSIITRSLLQLILRLWQSDELIVRLFSREHTDEYVQGTILNHSIYSEFRSTGGINESMIHYLMNDFVPRLERFLAGNESENHVGNGNGGGKLVDFQCNQTDYIFCSYKPNYRDLILVLNTENDGNQGENQGENHHCEVLVTTVNLETRDTIPMTTLLSQCDLLLFNLDLAIYSRNDLRDIVEMFCAKSRFENMCTHDSFYVRSPPSSSSSSLSSTSTSGALATATVSATATATAETTTSTTSPPPPIAMIRSGIDQMHSSLNRYGLGMLPSEMFDDSLTFLAPDKITYGGPRCISPDVPVKTWSIYHSGNDEQEEIVPQEGEEPIDDVDNEDDGGVEIVTGNQLSRDEWSQVIRFLGNPQDMLSMSQVCTMFRQMIDQDEQYWMDVVIGKSTTFAKQKKREAFAEYTKQRNEEYQTNLVEHLTGGGSMDTVPPAVPVTWKQFYLYSIRSIHQRLPDEICRFIVENKSLRYTQKEDRLFKLETLPLFNVDAMHISKLKQVMPKVLSLAVEYHKNKAQ